MAASNDEPSLSKQNSWDRDGKAGGPTSLDVLFNWIQVPGNYELWRGDDTRRRAIRSLLSEFNKSGITTRSKLSIQLKIRSLERQCATAWDWLEDRQISIDDVLNDTATSYEVGKLRLFCPHYRELVPMFQALQTSNGSESATEHAGSKRNDANDNNHRRKKRHQTAHPAVKCEVQPSTHSDFLRVDSCEVVTHMPSFEFSPDFQEKFMELTFEHHKKLSEDVLEGERKRRDAIVAQEIEFDKKRREALVEYEIHISKQKLTLEMSLAKATARNSLKKDGVATREINRFFPLPDK